MGKYDKINTHLNASDREIWNQISRTAKPLSLKDKNFTSMFAEIENVNTSNLLPTGSPQTGSLNSLKNTVSPVYQPTPPEKPALAAGTMDKKTSRKISKGRIAFDGRIDLHGLTQQEAYHTLFDYIENAWYSGKKILLVITGKGNLGRGVLRENVPAWLASAPFLPLISEFGESHSNHGGNGALYVRIRRSPNLGKQAY